MTRWSHDEVQAIYAERDKYRDLVREFVQKAAALGEQGEGSEFARPPDSENVRAALARVKALSDDAVLFEASGVVLAYDNVKYTALAMRLQGMSKEGGALRGTLQIIHDSPEMTREELHHLVRRALDG